MGQGEANVLSTVFFVMQNYREIDIDQLVKVTRFNRDVVRQALLQLNALGILGWQGKNLTSAKKVRVNDKIVLKDKPTFAEFVKDLEQKMKDKYGVSPGEGQQPVQHQEPPQQKERWMEIEYDSGLIIRISKQRLKALIRKELEV